jgi:hypothetical protein
MPRSSRRRDRCRVPRRRIPCLFGVHRRSSHPPAEQRASRSWRRASPPVNDEPGGITETQRVSKNTLAAPVLMGSCAYQYIITLSRLIRGPKRPPSRVRTVEDSGGLYPPEVRAHDARNERLHARRQRVACRRETAATNEPALHVTADGIAVAGVLSHRSSHTVYFASACHPARGNIS